MCTAHIMYAHTVYVSNATGVKQKKKKNEFYNILSFVRSVPARILHELRWISLFILQWYFKWTRRVDIK